MRTVAPDEKQQPTGFLRQSQGRTEWPCLAVYTHSPWGCDPVCTHGHADSCHVKEPGLGAAGTGAGPPAAGSVEPSSQASPQHKSHHLIALFALAQGPTGALSCSVIPTQSSFPGPRISSAQPLSTVPSVRPVNRGLWPPRRPAGPLAKPWLPKLPGAEMI